MKTIWIKQFFLVLMSMYFQSTRAQVLNTNCANAAPFCTGQVMSFPAQTGSGNAQAGPNYGCCSTQPGPNWFYLQIQNSGPMLISIAGTFDVDFVCWGPFPTLAGNCNGLTGNKIVSCGYSPSNTETCTINNAVAGQFYFLMITNYSGQAHNITFQQQNATQSGAATTNCGVLCGLTATNSGIICSGQSNTISAISNSAATTYTWFGPNSYSSTALNNVIPTLTATSTFSLKGTINSTVNNVAYTNTCQALTTISVIPMPTLNLPAGSTTAICQGGTVNAVAQLAAGSGAGPFTYTWFPGSGAGVISPSSPTTAIAPPPLAANVTVSTIVFSLSVTPNLANCPVTETLAVTINNPSNPTLSLPAPLCNTANTLNLLASPPGGTWSVAQGLSSSGSFSPSQAIIGNNTATYSVTINNCMVSKTGTFSVSQFNSSAISTFPGTLCANDAGYYLMNMVQSTVAGTWSGQAVSNNTFLTFGLPSGFYPLTYSTQSTPIASVCPSSSVYNLPVYKPVIPVIATIAPQCNNSGTVQLTASPSGGLWNATGISGSGIQFPGLNLIGINTVTYAAGSGTCVAKNTQTFEVSQFISAALNATLINVCAPAGSVNLMTRVQNTLNGNWMGPYVNNNYFVPSMVPSSTYVVNYTTGSSPNLTLCPDASTMMVSVTNPPIPNITAVGPFCSTNAPVQLTVSPNTGSWTANSFLNINGVINPSFCLQGSNLVQYSTGNSTCMVQKNAIIMVETFIPATLTGSVPDQCTTGGVINLSQITISNKGIWSGPGISGSLFNPATAGKGSYVLNYNTASQPTGLCTDFSSVSVNVYSLTIPILLPIGPFCNNTKPVQLNVNSLGGTFWGTNNNAISGVGVFNPAYAKPGANIVSYSISSGPCVAIAQTTIQVESFVSATLEKQIPPICKNAAQLNLNAFVQNPGGKWSGPGIFSSMFNPAKAAVGYNTFTYQTHSAITETLCPDTQTLAIMVYGVQAVVPTVSIISTCVPALIALSLPEPAKGTALWNYGDGTDTENGLKLNHTYSKAGNYTLTLNYTDEHQCLVSINNPMRITVYETPLVDFTAPEEVTLSESLVQLVNASPALGNNRYLWNIGNQYSVSEINPLIKFDKPGRHQITLTATSVQGCKAQTSKWLEVKSDFNVYVPDAFTPNHDGLNDTFMPVFSEFGVDKNNYELLVFDRWGKLMFVTKEINKGWDGLTANGSAEEAKQDVYIYKITFKDLDGTIHFKTGHVDLIK